MQKYVIALYIRLSIEDYKYDSLSIENQSLVLHELLGYVVQRAEFHTFNRRMHFGIVGHDDERLRHTLFAHPTQQVDTIAVR